MSELTQKELMEKLVYFDSIGKFFWLNSNSYKKHRFIGQEAGWISRKNKNAHYWYITINRKHYKRSQLAFLYTKGFIPELIDHKNGNSLDDRIKNLFPANKIMNSQNTIKERSNKKSELPIGVSFSKGGKKFRASISVNKKLINLGVFDSPDKAHDAYLKAKKKYHYAPALLHMDSKK